MQRTRIILVLTGTMLVAGCVSQPRMFSDAELDAYAYSAGVVNSPFMRYMDQRDAEARVSRQIADEFERRRAAAPR